MFRLWKPIATFFLVEGQTGRDDCRGFSFQSGPRIVKLPQGEGRSVTGEQWAQSLSVGQ
jgi:hypothetical protein